MRRLMVCFVILNLYAGCAASSQKTQQSTDQAENATEFTADLANKFAIYAMASSNAYLNFSDRSYFSIEDLGWNKVDTEGKPIERDINSYTPKTKSGDFFSNLQFDIWEHDNGKDTIIAFKGTEEKIDWFTGNIVIGVSITYKSAKKHVREYMESHPEREVIVTGHSLGGGLALSSSVWECPDAYVFDTSPRIFDGLKNANCPAIRVAIHQENEVLSKLRAIWPKFMKKMRPEDIIEAKFDFQGENKHRIDLLAEGILRCANSPSLVELAAKIKQKVKCYL